jgi:hypothetical protein
VKERSDESTEEKTSARHPVVPLGQLPGAVPDDLERTADLLEQ